MPTINGYDIVMIREECKKRPLVGVEFKATANKFEVIFKKDVQSVLDEIDKGILKISSVPRKQWNSERTGNFEIDRIASSEKA